MRTLTDELCRGAGFEPDLVFESDDVATIRGLVAGGLGVALIPAPRANAPDVDDGNIRCISVADAGAHRDVRLCWTSTDELSRPVELFRDHVVQRSRSGRLPPVAGAL